ncbi:transposase [Actinoplanes sp. NPDC051633]|uniref:transposase n=1 Tax=Actinoplanes sp. NPDC051633 TaxID=3155670 RepID=UPI003423B356
MALVRVYCGLASADESVRAGASAQLTIAVVDDAGRLLVVDEISDDPTGYARLGTLLVERTSGFGEVAVAADSDDHMVTSLLTAAGRPLVVTDDDTTDDFAERFADDSSVEEMQAPPAARRAVGLSRALQAGAIAAATVPVPRELISYKPILAAHVAMLDGRCASATALREVLRELYPAALRAFADPAHPLAMAVLDALPEPGRLTGRGSDSEQIAVEVVAELTRAGAGTEDQVTAAVTALVVAISESPRRGGVNKSLASSAADTVRQAIGAVRCSDNACEALIGTLAARVTAPSSTGRRAAGSRRAADPTADPTVDPAALSAAALPTRPSETGTRIGRRGRPEPAAGNTPVTPRPMTAPPVAPDPIAPPPMAPRPLAPHPSSPSPLAPAAAAGLPTRTRTTPGATTPGNRPVSVPPPPPGMTPIVPGARPVSPAESGREFRPTLTDAAMSKARAERQRSVIPPRPSTRPANGVTDYSLPMPASRPAEGAPPPGSRANWPLLNSSDEPAAPPPAAQTSSLPGALPGDGGRVRPPWQDMPTEPPALRLVESLSGLENIAADVTAVTEPPPLRLVDTPPPPRANGNPRGAPTRRTTLTALDRSTQPPVPDEGDGDLLIFAAARSAWFTGQSESADLDWTNPNDTGWRAAEKAATPEVAAQTSAGLPKRVPQANLVPGSPLRDEHPLRIVRDAASIAAHTTGYFRGWRRGQEIGGYAIGGRPGREAAGGWDFSRDGQPADDYRNSANGYQR